MEELPGSDSHDHQGKNETKRTMKSRHHMIIGECCLHDVGLGDASKRLYVDLLLIIARIGERFLLILSVRLAELSIFHGAKLLHSHPGGALL